MSTDRHLQPVPDESPNLIVMNAETGEQLGALEAHVEEHEHVYRQLENKYKGALAKISKLERDDEAEARKHKRWAEAEALHEWWCLATGHEGRKFGADEFYQVLPRLKERSCGPIGVLHAIAGAAFDPGTKQMKNGRTERYDDWELVTRSPAKLESFRNRAPGKLDGHEWKNWLLDRIERNFKS
jgi:hypothetical protein